jgi:hypothetical protein
MMKSHGVPLYETMDIQKVPAYPRCPEYRNSNNIEDLMPYFDSVAKRPYINGLHVAWDLKSTDNVLLRVDNWYDQICVDAAVKTLENYKCRFDVETWSRGPIKTLTGDNEVEFFLEEIPLIRRNLDRWRQMRQDGKYNKTFESFGGPILPKGNLRIQRFPFYTPEMVMSPAHTIPAEVLTAIDDWTWLTLLKAVRVRITDPEGTDLQYSNWDEYYNGDRTDYDETLVRKWAPEDMVPFYKTYQPGHVWGRPRFMIPKEDGRGVIGGTMNHIGPFPYIKIKVDKARLYDIEGGGKYGDDLRKIEEETKDIQYPGMLGKGLLYWWEASIGTNPKIHRPRKDFTRGMVCGLYERMRSGVIHLGFGTVLSSMQERKAADEGLIASHFHVHLYFPTVTLEMADGSRGLLIDNGHLKALDDPKVRAIASKYGNPDEILREDWIPALPGINMAGEYSEYAEDPLDWTLTELNICRKFHPLYMKMIAPGNGDAMEHDDHSHHHHH